MSRAKPRVCTIGDHCTCNGPWEDRRYCCGNAIWEEDEALAAEEPRLAHVIRDNIHPGEEGPLTDLWLDCESAVLSAIQAPAESGEPRFYIDHGMIHDRLTGRHVTTNPDDEVWSGGTISDCLGLLNQLATERDRLSKALVRVIAHETYGAGKCGVCGTLCEGITVCDCPRSFWEEDAPADIARRALGREA